MNVNKRQGACMFSLLQKYNNWNIYEIETTDPFYFIYKIRQNSHIYSYYQCITMNYCEEDGLHAIKLMAEVYLREIRMSLLLVWKCFKKDSLP